MPRGCERHAGHRHADALRFESPLVREDLPKVAWTSGDVAERVEALARDAEPLLRFGRAAASQGFRPPSGRDGGVPSTAGCPSPNRSARNASAAARGASRP